MSAPLSYKNWLAYRDEGSAHTIFEYPIYSDISVISELCDGLEPFSFHNAMPVARYKGEVVIPVVLRVGFSIDEQAINLTQSNFKNYHGGWINDEVAALMSLSLGARFYAGDEIRSFGQYRDDPLGTPQFQNRIQPPLSFIKSERYVLPEVATTKSLDDLKIIDNYQKLTSKSAAKIIQVARQYQNALWLSETDPSLTWIMLVSAAEVAANQWSKAKHSNSERLKFAFPDYYDFLEEIGNQDVIKKTADTFVDVTRSMRKFIDFYKYFLPDNICQESSKGFDCSGDNLEKALKIIYKYRSEALHGGIPFPAPMCHAPSKIDNFYWQKPTGLASTTLGSTWMSEDMPMNLHFFHYLTRLALINWWLECAKMEEKNLVDG